ncbi:hypothetical protein EGW08_011255 [Elysia chlorotica]|uniref:Uncharacterized protein n=1 Tax=Elysia chlorotica TaxID=188477 RepID=A0A3S1BDF4_ELYCH|nr:hypothetical protein EGW08_011255 [Elysia chlorotica]
MLVYAFLFFLCLGSIVSSSLLLFRGYKKTCDVLELNSHDPTSFKGIISSSRANEPTIPCSQLNTETVQLKSEGESVVVTDVHRAIIIAQVASVVLICLSCLQIIVCMGTFGVIWYHFHFLAMHLYTEEHSLNDDEMDDEWDMHTQNSDYIH